MFLLGMSAGEQAACLKGSQPMRRKRVAGSGADAPAACRAGAGRQWSA